MVPFNSGDLFRFIFPKTFIPEEIRKKYETYLNRVPTVLNDVSEFINWTVQAVSLPAVQYDPVSQIRRQGKIIDYRASTVPTDLVQHQIDVTFMTSEGYLNYWILLDVFNYYYKLDQEITHINKFRLQLLDTEGYVLTTVEFDEGLFKALSEIQLNYSDNISQFNTFTATFQFNYMNVKLEFDSPF